MRTAPPARRGLLTDGAQAINLHRKTWHGVLTPLAAPGLFAVIDRIGPGPNLEEHWFTHPEGGAHSLTTSHRAIGPRPPGRT